MSSRYQKTIYGEVVLEGIGLHTGKNSTLVLKPADVNVGIIFKRVDQKNHPIIPADIDYVTDTNRGTVIDKDGIRIHTVEHVLASLSGLGIDNVVIELSSQEPPILDGSALPFVQAIKKVGIVEQSEQQDVLKIVEPFRYTVPDSNIEINILPSEDFKITFLMDYVLPNFPIQYTSIKNVENEFEKEIAPARTFGLLSEVVHLKENGLIKGGGLNNAVVIIDKKVDEQEQKIISKLFDLKTEIVFYNGGILNSEELRFENEPVRHKVLDLIGDMSLFGKPIVGHIIATRSGHSTNIEAIKKLRQLIKP